MISAPAHNNELPRLMGFNQKLEDDMYADQKLLAASATAVCVSVDSTRRIVVDLKDSANDFLDGKVEDPNKEASRIMLAVASLLEEEAISSSVQAVKFLASGFGAITLSKS